jgi:hypothetical protein
MIKRIHKILVLVICISFFLSAAEMDIGNTNNTFFDEYDTYLKEDNLSIDYTLFSAEEQLIYFVTPGLFLLGLIDHIDASLKNTTFNSQITYNTSKLFLYNSVWRI